MVASLPIRQTHPSLDFESPPLMQACLQFKRTFQLEYRLSTAVPYPAQNPFPTALIDALAGYKYFVNDLGVSPNDIFIGGGDSAGGNLALTLARYLVESRGKVGISLPAPPAGLILLSPWVDMGVTHETPESSMVAFVSSYTLERGGVYTAEGDIPH